MTERCRTGISDCRERCTALDLLRRMEVNEQSDSAIVTYCQTIRLLALEATCDNLLIVERVATAVEGRAIKRQEICS